MREELRSFLNDTHTSSVKFVAFSALGLGRGRVVINTKQHFIKVKAVVALVKQNQRILGYLLMHQSFQKTWRSHRW